LIQRVDDLRPLFWVLFIVGLFTASAGGFLDSKTVGAVGGTLVLLAVGGEVMMRLASRSRRAESPLAMAAQQNENPRPRISEVGVLYQRAESPVGSAESGKEERLDLDVRTFGVLDDGSRVFEANVSRGASLEPWNEIDSDGVQAMLRRRLFELELSALRGAEAEEFLEPLVEALLAAGVATSVEELRTLPLRIEFDSYAKRAWGIEKYP
jgi:hypothetical protein